MTDKGIIVIAGATGVVGRHLISEARRAGYHLRALSRQGHPDLPKDVESFEWHPQGGAVQEGTVAALEGASLVINLAGSSIGEGRMDEGMKERVLQSRLDATQALVEAHSQCTNPPAVWLQASAIGYYGNTAERTVTEQTPPASDWFLAEVCRKWEAEALSVQEKSQGVRLIIGRIGLVLAEDAPAWQKMILPIKLGVGGKLGSGKQWYAWIDADDLARAMLYLAEKQDASGVYNFTAPQPTRQEHLVKQVARSLKRPSFLSAPAFVLKAILGEAADALLLASCKALPTRLLETGFVFEHPDIESELDSIL